MIDILKHNWKFPSETVYIIGTGHNGKDHYGRIPFDAWTIGVNKAIQLQSNDAVEHSPDIRERMENAEAANPDKPCIPISIWLCADTTLPEEDWFKSEVGTTIACEFPLDNNLNPTPVFSTSPNEDIALTTVYPDVPYYFTHGYSLRERPAFVPLEGMLRAGGSISAQAIQLAYWLGAKRIILVGVDMAGKTYFDDTENSNPNLKADGTSKHLRMTQGLCDWLLAEGIEIISLSETALKVTYDYTKQQIH